MADPDSTKVNIAAPSQQAKYRAQEAMRELVRVYQGDAIAAVKLLRAFELAMKQGILPAMITTLERDTKAGARLEKEESGRVASVIFSSEGSSKILTIKLPRDNQGFTLDGKTAVELEMDTAHEIKRFLDKIVDDANRQPVADNKQILDSTFPGQNSKDKQASWQDPLLDDEKGVLKQLEHSLIDGDLKLFRDSLLGLGSPLKAQRLVAELNRDFGYPGPLRFDRSADGNVYLVFGHRLNSPIGLTLKGQFLKFRPWTSEQENYLKVEDQISEEEAGRIFRHDVADYYRWLCDFETRIRYEELRGQAATLDIVPS